MPTFVTFNVYSSPQLVRSASGLSANSLDFLGLKGSVELAIAFPVESVICHPTAPGFVSQSFEGSYSSSALTLETTTVKICN